ncbi:MAG: hypothetical protein ACFFCE_01740 [Promethearchaeota archaeon]
MSIEYKLAGINHYYSANISFIVETVASTMQFWGYITTFMEDGSIKAIKDKSRPFYFYPHESKQKPLITNKLEKAEYQINRKPETIKNHILKMGLIYLFSLFEAFNKDYFQELFTYKPDLMKSKKRKIDYENILQFGTIEDLHKSLAENIVDKFGYRDIDKFAKFILKNFKIDLDNNLECWLNLRESYYRRNCIVHNDGKISELYLKKLSLGNNELNQELDCDIEYLWNLHHDIHSYIDFIDESIRQKFNLKSFIDSV